MEKSNNNHKHFDMKKRAMPFFVSGGLLLLIPVTLEFLVDIGVLHEHGTKLDQRVPVYAIFGLIAVVLLVLGVLTVVTNKKPQRM